MAGMVALEIFEMAPAAGPIQVLMSGPAEAVYDVETARMRRTCGQSREHDDAKRLPSAWHAKDSNLQSSIAA